MQRSLNWRILQVIARIFTTVWFNLKTYGRENVPQTGGVLLLANHQSYLDPVLVSVHLKRPVSFMARSSLFKNPFFARFIRSLNAFPVRLGQGDVSAIKECVRQLQEGRALNVYPEGTRTLTGKIGAIEKGIALVIRKACVPVVPVAIDGSFEAWPRGKVLFHPHRIRLIYGKPMLLHELKGDEIVSRLEQALNALLDQLHTMDKKV
jgi:1-acyl-sn-glycerol-3-phosphate acyltransferase